MRSKHSLSYSFKTVCDHMILAMCVHATYLSHGGEDDFSQSFDGCTYSFQGIDHTDGAITLDCNTRSIAGGIRYNLSRRLESIVSGDVYFENADEKIRQIASAEALQYLLIEVEQPRKGLFRKPQKVTMPILTTAFWSEGEHLWASDPQDTFEAEGGSYIAFLAGSDDAFKDKMDAEYELTDEDWTSAYKLADAFKNGRHEIPASWFADSDAPNYEAFCNVLSGMGIKFI